MTSASRTVAITGASGFLGSALAAHFRATGDLVVTVGRSPGSDVRWDPARGTITGAALGDADRVVNLAGSTIGQRWTAAVRPDLKASRVAATRLLCETLARQSRRPAVLLSGSAIGIYGSRGDEWLDESSAPGSDYLAEVASAWEAATAPAREAGIRTVLMRTGIVLHPRGGALAKMLLPFQLGAGGRLGDGRQWMSWISRTDWLAAVAHLAGDAARAGAVNVVGPEPVTNATFTDTLGRILRRPTVAAVPAFALKALFGEMAGATVLASQRVRAGVLEASGFRFSHPTLSSALRAELDLA